MTCRVLLQKKYGLRLSFRLKLDWGDMLPVFASGLYAYVVAFHVVEVDLAYLQTHKALLPCFVQGKPSGKKGLEELHFYMPFEEENHLLDEEMMLWEVLVAPLVLHIEFYY